MNYQNLLLNRKGRFGTIWLAAHHPTKISKYEIVQLDLTEKCEEIVEFVVNGRANRPRFSLCISSHLMYGLCVLLKKKNQYLFDDLMYLSQEIHKCYINETIVIKAKRPKGVKTPKKVKQLDKTAITLKENLPELDISNMTSFYAAEHERLSAELEKQRAEQELVARIPLNRITIEETFDVNERSVFGGEYDFLADSFGAAITAAETEIQPPRITETQIDLRESLFNIENLEKTVQPGVTPISKLAEARKKREPFKELSVNEQIRRTETHLATGLEANIEESTILNEIESMLVEKHVQQPPTVSRLEVPKENIPPSAMLGESIPFPELFQETITEQAAAQMTSITGEFEPAETIHVQPELQPPIEVPSPEVPPAVQQPLPAPPVEVPVEEVSVREPIPTVRRRTKRRGLLIDERTEIPIAELKKRMKRVEETSDEENHETALDRLFEKNRSDMRKMLSDYLNQDLFKHPSSRLMARTTKRIYSNRELKFYGKTKLIEENKCLTSSRQPSDQYTYTTEASRRRVEVVANEQVPEVVPEERPTILEDRSAIVTGINITAESDFERRREGRSIDERREGGVSRLEREHLRRSVLKRSSILEKTSEKEGEIDQRVQFEDSTSYQYQHQEQFIPQPIPEESSHFTPVINIQPPSPTVVVQPEAILEINDYERIITEGIRTASSQNRKAILQDLIRTESIPDRCLQATKPRKLFACKMFMQTLNMCKDTKIKAEQTEMYGNIELDF